MPNSVNQAGEMSPFIWQASETLISDTPTLLLVSYASLNEALETATTQGRHDVGLWFEPTDEPENVPLSHLQMVTTIGIHFPAFTDGRGFSIGKLLRQRFGFTGNLIATGELLVDQADYLFRCGFSHVVLPDTIDEAAFKSATESFSAHYQIV